MQNNLEHFNKLKEYHKYINYNILIINFIKLLSIVF